MKLEAPPGFEPGMEVLQGHPPRAIGEWPDADRNHNGSIGYMNRNARSSCLALAQIGRPWIVAGTVWAQLIDAAERNTQSCDTGP